MTTSVTTGSEARGRSPKVVARPRPPNPSGPSSHGAACDATAQGMGCMRACFRENRPYDTMQCRGLQAKAPKSGQTGLGSAKILAAELLRYVCYLSHTNLCCYAICLFRPFWRAREGSLVGLDQSNDAAAGIPDVLQHTRGERADLGRRPPIGRATRREKLSSLGGGGGANKAAAATG